MEGMASGEIGLDYAEGRTRNATDAINAALENCSSITHKSKAAGAECEVFFPRGMYWYV